MRIFWLIFVIVITMYAMDKRTQKDIDFAEQYSLKEKRHSQKTFLTEVAYAAQTNDQRLIKLYINYGLNDYISAQDITGQTSLHYAAQYGNEDLVKFLYMNARCKIGTVIDRNGNMPFHFACASGNIELVNFILLVEKERNINAMNYAGHTPLHFALHNKNHRNAQTIIELLLASGARPDLKGYNAKTPVDYALSLGHKESARILGTYISTKQLYDACFLNDMPAVEKILNMGSLKKWFFNCYDPDVNLKIDGNTVLHVAAEKSCKIIKLLLAKGSLINIRNNEGFTPLQCALKSNTREQAFLLLHSNQKLDFALTINNDRSVLDMVDKDDDEMFNVLIEQGGAPHISPRTIAHCTDKRFDLLKGKVNLDKTNAAGETALFIATNNNFIERIRSLLGAGAKYAILNNKRETLLHRAAYQNSLEVIKLLLPLFPNTNMQDLNGNTALHNICFSSKSKSDMASLLINANANINIKNKLGQTPLMLAVTNGHCELVKILLDAGAQVNTIDNKKQTALHEAVLSNNELITKLLIEHAADLTVRNNNKKTPVDIARDQKNTILMELFSKSRLVESEAECTICLEKETNCTTVCGHQFHQLCINQWQATSNSCPECRFQIISEE